MKARLMGGLFALAWAAAVLAAYHYTHKPVTPAQALALAQVLVALLAWLSTLALAHRFGRWCAPFTAQAPSRERLAYRLGLGLGLLGLLMLALGFAGLYRPALAWAMLAIGLPLGLRGLWQDCVGALPRVPRARGDRLLAAFVAFSLGSALLFALAPPVAWDALVYHLTGPKLYIALGRLHHEIDIPYLGFPHWPAMLYTWGLLTGGAATAQLVHWSFAVLTLALVPGLAGRLVPGRGWLAAALLLSAPGLVVLAGWPYAEWHTMFCVTAGLCAALRWHDLGQGPLRWLLVAGVLAGLALAAKYTALGAVLGMALAVGWMAWARRAERAGPAAAALPLLAFGAALLLADLPYLLKNIVLTGNPISPFFLPGKYWDPLRAWWFGRFGSGAGLAGALAAPWTLMASGAREEDTGPLFLALLPLLILVGRGWPTAQRRALGWMLAVCGPAVLVWILGIASSRLLNQNRLVFAIYPLGAVLAAAAYDGLGRLDSPRLRVRWVFGGLLALGLALAALGRLPALVQENPARVILGLQSQDEYLADRLGFYYSAMQAVSALPGAPRVLFLWETRAYYCEATCLPDTLLDRWWHLRRLHGEPPAIVDYWRSQNISHVLLFETGRRFVLSEGFDPITPQDWSALERLRDHHLDLVADLDGVYYLYSLRP